MSKPKLAVLVLCSLMISVSYPQKSFAEKTTEPHFLELDDGKKKFLILGTIDTLAVVAAQQSKEIGQCVFDWYYEDVPNKNSLILASMAKYKDYELATVVIALTEAKCGRYIRGKTTAN